MGAALRHFNVEIEVVSCQMTYDVQSRKPRGDKRKAIRAGVQTERTCLAGSHQTTQTL